MPIYDFICKECDHSFEHLVRGSTFPPCPKCSSAKVEKCVSLPAPPNKIPGQVARARAQASREGHFSNYAPAERPGRK